jgi:adiponectin receptor
MEGIRRRRPSEQQEQQSPTLTSALHKIESALPSLLHWDDLPPWRRDNAFLLTSYRHDTPSLTHVVKSALTLHNETVNIWSHLLAAVFFAGVSWWAYVVVKPRYEASADTADVLVFAAYLAGAVACLGMSATYHAVSSHSETVARLGNKLDYGGIVALIVGSFIPTLYYGFFCRPSLMVPYMSMVSPSCLVLVGVELTIAQDCASRRRLCGVCVCRCVSDSGVAALSGVDVCCPWPVRRDTRRSRPRS